MGLSDVERIMGRRQIDALINADPVDVVFHRRTRVSTPGGGWKYGEEVEVNDGEPQEATLIPFKRRMTEFLVNTEIGEVPDLPYVLLGRHDLDVQPDDWFIVNGEKLEVKTIDLKREVRIAAHVDYYGASSA